MGTSRKQGHPVSSCLHVPVCVTWHVHVETAQTVFYVVIRAKLHPPLSHAFAASTSDVYMYESEDMPQYTALKALSSLFTVLSRKDKKSVKPELYLIQQFPVRICVQSMHKINVSSPLR